MPFLFSPEHVGQIRPLLEEGFARSGGGKGFADFDIAPNTSICIDDDAERARDTMRPLLALYIGGMGSREKNFYNRTVRAYGYEDAAQAVQDHYLAGRRDEAMAALPDELIDAVTLCGPPDRVRDRLRALEDAGVGTLIATPMAFEFDARLDQLRRLAELAA
jgi:alkanesulfonate monooxygenase SsuD/methylene tetrahydromethanopterin reductase-like flavin-dependent oxidoreductase (luciferase family)